MEGSLAKRSADLLIVGLNHRSAPVEVRERLAFDNGTLEVALRRLVDAETVREGGRVRGLALAVPGTIDTRAGVVRKAPNVPGLSGFPLGETLSLDVAFGADAAARAEELLSDLGFPVSA